MTVKHVEPHPKKDYLGSHRSSSYLVRNIEHYWKSKGFPTVRAWVEEMDYGKGKIYLVRSNLVNGSPPIT